MWDPDDMKNIVSCIDGVLLRCSTRDYKHDVSPCGIKLVYGQMLQCVFLCKACGVKCSKFRCRVSEYSANTESVFGQYVLVEYKVSSEDTYGINRERPLVDTNASPNHQ